MATTCLKLALASWALSTSLAFRRSSNKVKEHRSDDVSVSESEGITTASGCACRTDLRNECRVSQVLNCRSKPFCNVDKKACPGARWHLLEGSYDFCSFPDEGVKIPSAGARHRHRYLVRQLKKDTASAGFISGISVLLGVRRESVIDSMEIEHDIFPYERKKYVRPVGVVAPISFVSRGNHAYTGVFKGNDLGIVRLSLSLEPTDGNGFAPGIAVKFLRDNKPSANFLGFNDFVGQNCSEPDWFKTYLYTHVPPATGSSALVPRKFEQATGCTQMVGLSDAADEFDGTTPNFPFSIRFKGTQRVDFSCGDKGAAGWANLGKLPKGTKLYTVEAQRQPGDSFAAIGDIVLQDSLTTSKFGDEQLFFRHQRMEEDFALHPEWLSAIDKKKECGTDWVTTEAPKPEEGCSYYSIV